MADRMVRDELLDSDRYWALPSDTHRMLFMHFVLTADDLGNAPATMGQFRRRLLQRDTPIHEPECAQLIAELSTADIVRPYEADGKRYVHIPRFRQRLRSYKRVHPRPPQEIEDKQINELMSNLRDKCPSDATQMTDTRLTRAVEVKRSEELQKPRARGQPVDNFSPGPRELDPQPQPRAKDSPNVNGHGQVNRQSATVRAPPDWRRNAVSAAAYGATLGAAPMPGEALPAYVARLDRLLAMLGPGQRPRRAEKPP